MGVHGVMVVATAPGFEDFYAQAWPDLFDFVATLIDGDRLTAEELTQEAMARVFVRFGRLDDARPYAFRIASNLVKRRWALQQREPLLDPTALPDRPGAQDHDHTVDAVRRLPTRLRDVVLLHYYADLPVETIARLVHRPTGTVKARLHEARARLATQLQEDPR
jgi:RNA polymerase sigma-70 factor (ECF subfamily)